jgi:C1A family cysteine protease
MRKTERFGYRPDLGDPRDHAYERGTAPLPKSVDLRTTGFLPPVWDQGQLGSCVWHATPAGLMFARAKAGTPVPMPSRLAGYYETRKIEGDVKQDAGCEIRDAIKVLVKEGVPPESEWPYVETKFAKAPPAKVLADGKPDEITGYQRLNNVADYLDCLAKGYPVIIGVSVFQALESNAVAKSGSVPMPGKHDTPIGGHAILLTGYETDGRFIFRNSWSADWGMNGYGHFPHAYIADANLATDAWVILA